jgi:SAM-dependent methyltransferase
MNNDLVKYYKDRASEYERIYYKPERQEDLKSSAVHLQELFKEKEVFEIACGTGFWTERILKTAHSVLASDINLSVLEVAKQKEFVKENPNIRFEVADIYNFQPAKKYESLFGGFIWSHIPKQELDYFFETLNNFVLRGGTIVLMDNAYVEGSNLPITETDAHGNTFQTRKLDDGSTHKVLKNFATESFLKEKIKGFATEINFIQMKYFWILSYKI